MKIKVILVDDELLLTDLLKQFLELDAGIEVMHTFNSGHSFLEKMGSDDGLLDVLVLDFRIGDIDGVEVFKQLRLLNITVPVILMSSHYNDHLIGFIVKSGFAAFIPKNIKPALLIEIIYEVYRKGFYLMPAQFELLREQMVAKTPVFTNDLKMALTEREIEVLYLIAQQKTTKEIADALFLSPKTVEGHKNNLFLKTGVKNVVGLIVYGVQNRILDIDKIAIL